MRQKVGLVLLALGVAACGGTTTSTTTTTTTVSSSSTPTTAVSTVAAGAELAGLSFEVHQEPG